MYDYIKKKDLVTTTASHGFRLTAYIVKDSSGNVIEKVVKPHGKVLAEHIPDILRKVLSGNELGYINQDALQFFRRCTAEMLDHF